MLGDFQQEITLSIAIIGAALGVFNLYLQLSQKKVKLKVIPKLRFVHNNVEVTSTNYCDDVHLDDILAIEVINLSSFPVVISEVGFAKRGINGRVTMLPNWTKIPHKLEPREAKLFVGIEVSCLWKDLPMINKAFAATSCDSIKYGSSDALKSLVVSSKAYPS